MTASINLRRHCLAGGSETVARGATGSFDRDQLRARVLALAPVLAVRPERSWGVWYRDAYEFLCGFMALALAGKRLVMPHNMQSHNREIGTAAQVARQFDALLTDAPLPELPVPQLTPEQLAAEPSAQWPDIDGLEWPVVDSSVELILFTSGSTGEPQPISKSLDLLEAELAILDATFGERLGQSEVVATVSHQHIYGLLHRVLWPWWRGAPFGCGLCQYPEELVQALESRGPATLVSSPTHLARLPKAPVFRDQPPAINATISSGGLLAGADARALSDLIGAAPLEILGSTETGGVAWRSQSETEHWQALPGVNLTVSPRGCLQVASAHLGATEPFEMGDRVELLGDGRFRLMGRADRIVKVEGKRLSLTEMQNRLEEHPAVAEARLEVVRGRREEVGAVVVLSGEGDNQLSDMGKLPLNQTLRAHLLAYFERPLLPRRWRYLSELPVNSQGKVTAESLQNLLIRREN